MYARWYTDTAYCNCCLFFIHLSNHAFIFFIFFIFCFFLFFKFFFCTSLLIWICQLFHLELGYLSVVSSRVRFEHQGPNHFTFNLNLSLVLARVGFEQCLPKVPTFQLSSKNTNCHVQTNHFTFICIYHFYLYLKLPVTSWKQWYIPAI